MKDVRDILEEIADTDKKIKTGNYDEKIIDIVYEYFETFNTTIVDWVINGDKRAQNFFLEIVGKEFLQIGHDV